jgi:hypothetical protein
LDFPALPADFDIRLMVRCPFSRAGSIARVPIKRPRQNDAEMTSHNGTENPTSRGQIDNVTSSRLLTVIRADAAIKNNVSDVPRSFPMKPKIFAS